MLDACRALHEAAVTYVVVGGFAVAVWGDPRPTLDVDIIADVRPGDGLRLSRTVARHGLRIAPADLEDAVRERSHATIFDSETIYHVDIMPAHSPGHRATLQGRRGLDVAGVRCFFASPEDTIANKLRFGSEQDLRDAAGIYARQREKLDMKLVEERCLSLEVWNDFLALKERVDRAVR